MINLNSLKAKKQTRQAASFMPGPENKINSSNHASKMLKKRTSELSFHNFGN